MLRLHQIFLINVVVIFTVLVGIMLGMSYYSTKQIDISAQKSNLRKSIGITKQLLIANSSGESMDQFVQKIKKLSGYRVTLIDEKGVVIAETDSDKGLMVNHLTRPEIMQSMREEIGLEVRHSTTINKDLVYVATKVDINHSVVYLRLAAEVSGYEQYLYALWYQIAYVFVFALMIAIFFSYRINKRIEGQISNIASYLI